jgi:disulfide oxidoreductase YuzD
MTNINYIAIYEVKDNFHSKQGIAKYENENEMYADLEVQGITEENGNVRFLQFFEVMTVNSKNYVSNSWM